MPGPRIEPAEPNEPAGRHAEPAAVPDAELAIALPAWNPLPPAEFLDRHPRR
jgi:hypothetical protein